MRVILLATDEVEKLPSLTTSLPAPMIPIVNRPVMAIAIELLARAGLKDIVVSLCHRSADIVSYFGNGSRWGVHLEYVVQQEALGSAGALRWAAHSLTETFLVLPADAVIDIDIEAALAYHRAHGGLATLMTHTPMDGRTPHPVTLDAQDRVLVADDQLEGRTMWSTEAYIFEPEILTHIPPYKTCDCYTDLVPTLLAAGISIYGHTVQGYWNTLETASIYQEAQRVFLYSAYAASQNAQTLPEDMTPRVRYPSIEGRQIAPGIWVGANHTIHRSARLSAPLCIGDSCRIGRGVELGPEVVLGSHVVIDDEATVQQSTVLSRTYLGRLIHCDGRIVDKTRLTDIASSITTEVVDPFLLTALQEPQASLWLWWAINRVVAFLLLLLALPLILVIASIIWLGTNGKVVIGSSYLGARPRMTRQRGLSRPETFQLLMFQTLRLDGSPSRFGCWLKHVELDWLPALWNVVRGDLDLVGVKPLTPEEATYLSEEWHFKRYDCPAGLTGLWYVQTDEQTDLDTTLVADAYYAATSTVPSALRLLSQTPAVWLRRARRFRPSTERDVRTVTQRTA